MDRFDKIVQLIISRDEKSLSLMDRLPLRALIDYFKNDLENLEYLFQYMQGKYPIPGAGTYHFGGLKSVKTFDIYMKYGFHPVNFVRQEVPEEHYRYAVSIGYIIPEEHDDPSAESSDDTPEHSRCK